MDILLCATPWPALNRLDSLDGVEDEKFTTGDVVLDKALGGGIRTGMVWEVVGERYASIYSGVYVWVIINICHQFCWKNATCPSTFAVRTSPSRARGFVCMCLLLDDLLETAYESVGPDFRAQ